MDKSKGLGIESYLSVSTIQAHSRSRETATDPPSQELVYALLDRELLCEDSDSYASYSFGCQKQLVPVL